MMGYKIPNLEIIEKVLTDDAKIRPALDAIPSGIDKTTRDMGGLLISVIQARAAKSDLTWSDIMELRTGKIWQAQTPEQLAMAISFMIGSLYSWLESLMNRGEIADPRIVKGGNPDGNDDHMHSPELTCDQWAMIVEALNASGHGELSRHLSVALTKD